MNQTMFCYQCEQTAGCSGCSGKAGVCGKTADTARLQDTLTGALIGLVRATNGSLLPANHTEKLLIEGLFATLTNVNFDDEALQMLIDQVHAHKTMLVPQCGGCGAPCGHNNDYDMNELWNTQEDIRSLKSLILFGIRGVAAYAYHAMVLGYNDPEVKSVPL